ncbi:aminotransferase class I/II-fold pyridoxal phosphate-dependent enzyme [Pontibacillus yanchengensis]|uniref:Aminotransferase class I/II-fold pyridoxal phosphate-dependent enzyme n=2 Tax=Pontibacillus yanchengensis TaxID=462910 RepID=A0ACC7VK80_9BACI|nr:pyridoxal phosphate-dependent aminotransferase [Pontibacillus yanchengensis]MYL32778.1 aminotransferase class I/II-fold pyridoxal phosphate-dependent enzyme [Pontibacillus yanchengensis]MYL55172.1 aminotransferase class I/II-fold pyridoxal phosphate-dependent enzyme [Pontibacillus yanchengensis]
MELAKRVQTLTPSSTLAITAMANALKAEGHDVIGLGAGEPDFNTPENILEAAQKAMYDGHTKYTPSGGIPALKEAIIKKYKVDHQLTYETNQVIVTTGAKHALYTLFQALLDPGEEVIVPAPYWVSYPEQIKLAEGTPVVVKALEENDFKLTPEQVEEAITDRTKAIIINSPSNPTGMLYSKDELEKIGEVCKRHNVFIISDEIYEKLIYGEGTHVSMAQVSEELKNQTIIINGVSKSHAMTGWRIGYALGDEKLIKAMTNLASHSTSNPTTIAQYAALEAYTSPQEKVEEMKTAFSHRLEKLYDWITDIPGVECVKPKGAFYLFPNVSKAVEANNFDSVDDWVKALLEEEKVALVPGSGFGSEQNVRLSYATSLDQLEEASKRIRRFVEKHQS